MQDQAGLKVESMTGAPLSVIRFNAQQGVQAFAARISAKIDQEPQEVNEIPRPAVVTQTFGFGETRSIPNVPPQLPVFNGQDGSDGATGPTGPTPTFFASGTTLATNLSVTATLILISDPANYKLALGIPQGKTGVTGPRGPTGIFIGGLTAATNIVTDAGVKVFTFTGGGLVSIT